MNIIKNREYCRKLLYLHRHIFSVDFSIVFRTRSIKRTWIAGTNELQDTYKVLYVLVYVTWIAVTNQLAIVSIFLFSSLITNILLTEELENVDSCKPTNSWSSFRNRHHWTVWDRSVVYSHDLTEELENLDSPN